MAQPSRHGPPERIPDPPPASALRTPISIAGSYAAPFAMMGHHEMNGSLTSPGAYAGLHNIPPQMSAAAAAAAAYGRSPMVSFGAVRSTFSSFFRSRWAREGFGDVGGFPCVGWGSGGDPGRLWFDLAAGEGGCAWGLGCAPLGIALRWGILAWVRGKSTAQAAPPSFRPSWVDQELGSMILMGPFHLGIFYDSIFSTAKCLIVCFKAQIQSERELKHCHCCRVWGFCSTGAQLPTWDLGTVWGGRASPTLLLEGLKSLVISPILPLSGGLGG